MVDDDKEEKQFEFSERENFITSQWKIVKVSIKLDVRKLFTIRQSKYWSSVELVIKIIISWNNWQKIKWKRNTIK